MSRTIKEFRGVEYREKGNKWYRKFKSAKKFLGFTSGTHSHGDRDKVAVKGENFVKYGWPFETRNHKVVKDLIVTRELDNELKEYK